MKLAWILAQKPLHLDAHSTDMSRTFQLKKSMQKKRVAAKLQLRPMIDRLECVRCTWRIAAPAPFIKFESLFSNIFCGWWWVYEARKTVWNALLKICEKNKQKARENTPVYSLPGISVEIVRDSWASDK